MWNPNLALFSQSEAAFPVKWTCLNSSKFHIENESKVDEIHIEVRNRIELNLVRYKLKVNQIEKFVIFDPALSLPYRAQVTTT